MIASGLRRLQLAAVLCSALGCYAQTDWPVYGHDPGGMRFSPLHQIDTSNVQKLVRAWTYHTGEVTGEAGPRGARFVALETTPLVIDNVMYVSTPGSKVIALDPEIGRELWKFDPQSGAPGKPLYRAHRGVAYWPGDSKAGARILFGTLDGRLIALSAKTGKPVPGFGTEGQINLRQDVAAKYPDAAYAVTSPPAIYRDLVITGAEVPESPGHGPLGDIRAFDIRTGKLAWRFHTVPHDGGPGADTWEPGSRENRTGANVWSMMTVDTERGIVFLPIGSPAYDFYGGDRKGKDLYGNSLVALDAQTGKVRWYYQLVHHDIWDYDPPAPPALVTVRRDGREIPAVVQVTKMGLVFIFDRTNGEPLYPIQETPVPKSDVPGEQTWPTQPIPLKPPPLSRSTITRAELTDVTPESKRYCEDLFDQLSTAGRYTPYGTKLTLVYPGTLGGATWSGVSFDPNLRFLFVNTNETGAIGQMVKQAEGSPVAYRRASPHGEYARFWDENMWPCQRPPWGLLNAINIDTGEIAWRVPLGVTDALQSRDTGAPNIGGSIATAGGLVFIAATNDSRFRAFDSRTGRELWTAKIEASGHATPMTYLGKNGKQYVVIAAGGGGFFGSAPSDVIAAYALP